MGQVQPPRLVSGDPGPSMNGLPHSGFYLSCVRWPLLLQGGVSTPRKGRKASESAGNVQLSWSSFIRKTSAPRAASFPGNSA